jgi:capsular polysaccharide biosynthesis protein
MTNEAELVAYLRDLGFHILSGRGLSLEEQVSAFSDAKPNLHKGHYGRPA